MTAAYRSFVRFGDSIAAFRLDGSGDVFAADDVPAAPDDHGPTLAHLARLGAPFRSTWARDVDEADLEALRGKTAVVMATSVQHAALGAMQVLPESAFALARIVRQVVPGGGRVLMSPTLWSVADILGAAAGDSPQYDIVFLEDDVSADAAAGAHRAGIFADLSGHDDFDAVVLDSVALDGGRTGGFVRASAAVKDGAPVIGVTHRREGQTYNHSNYLLPLSVRAAFTDAVVRLTASFDVPSSCFDVVVFGDDEDAPLGAASAADVVAAESPLARHPWGEQIADFDAPVDADVLKRARTLVDAAFGFVPVSETEGKGAEHFDLTTTYADEGSSLFAVHPETGVVSFLFSHWSPARLFAAALALSAVGPARSRFLDSSSAA